MRVFEDISISYKVINKKAYPKIKIDGLIRVPDFNPLRGDSFILHKWRVQTSNELQMQKMANAIFSQSMMYYMNNMTYMSAYIFMNNWADFVEDPITDISEFFKKSQYNIIDMDTSLGEEMYIYRITGRYNNEVYTSSYIAGVRHFNISSEELDHVDPEEVGGLMPINMGLGNIFCSDDIYTIDKEKRIYIKGLATNTITPRYKGPIDHTVEKANRDSIIKGLDFINNIYSNIDNSFSDILSNIDDITKDITSSYRRI